MMPIDMRGNNLSVIKKLQFKDQGQAVLIINAPKVYEEVMASFEGYEPVRQIAIDEDWSALRFRKTGKIKTMKRGFAVTEEGKQRTEQ